MKLFCDSGAYSAWANKTKIDLQEYIDFIQANKSQLEVYACLDDITSPEKTWENQKEMERQGLKPLPVYHTGEDIKYLKKAMNYDYFAIGGMALESSVNREIFFDDIFCIICPKENDYYPTHKVHGFGLASPNFLIDYPWYSVDTTSWVQYGRYGIILLPRMKYGRIRYDLSPITLPISSRSKSIGHDQHYRNYSPDDKELINKYCESKGFAIGKTLIKTVKEGYELKENENWIDKKKKDKVEVIIEKGLCCDGEMRDKINLEYFLDLEKYQPKWPWQFKAVRPLSLFD